jgi:hypothetical protein
MKIKILIAIAVISASLSVCVGCQSGITPPDTTSILEVDESGYPPPQEEISDADGYPANEYTPPDSAPEIEIDSSLGIVFGRILHNGEPVVGYSVYLADLLEDEKGQELVASLKRTSSPQAILDKDGNFVFNNVVPDRYALMFSDGMNSFLLLVPQQETDEAIIADVSAGEKIDLGTLDYFDFPLEQ